MASRKKVGSTNVTLPPDYTSAHLAAEPKKFSWKKFVLVLSVVFLVLALTNKGWIVAATVNGRPIFSWELNRAMRSRFGQQTLEGMIGEMLIAQEARKSGVSVSQADVDSKQEEVLASLGENVKLDDLLKFQGLTKTDFENQLKLQLTVERLLTKDLSISEADVNNYIATNRATLTATDPGKLKEEATQAIKTNLVNSKIQTWFSEIRQQAKILKFL